MIATPADLGALVRARRKALGLTQADLAARCGTGERFIVELEAGKSTVQLGKALLAAREVGLRLVDASARPSAPADTPPDDGKLDHLPRF
ncbi:helix-turn-helix transcriptional regulator [Salinarimonas sp.]|uniref:helix-turn-helix transcriptional regulator n=1 Tax=Salinarimonas sp. TaxID=2766526 RepID=UPI0032D8D71F